MAKCPYCGKEIAEHERICWQCEKDISKTRDKLDAPEDNIFKRLIEDCKKIVKSFKKKK